MTVLGEEFLLVQDAAGDRRHTVDQIRRHRMDASHKPLCVVLGKGAAVGQGPQQGDTDEGMPRQLRKWQRAVYFGGLQQGMGALAGRGR